MKRIPLQLPDEYCAALSERFGFELSSENLATRAGKTYIAKKAENVSRITKGLTLNRNEFLASNYLKNKEIRESYALYYMTTNLLKIFQPLRELAISGFFEKDHLRILDLGTGTGAAMWGLLSYLQNNIPLEITLTDSITENLTEAKKFSGIFIRHLDKIRPILSFEKFDLEEHNRIPISIQEKTPFDLVTIVNVLNELDENNDPHLLEMILSLLDEHGTIIMIEPATRLESRRLLRFRDMAIRQGITLYSPCTRQGNCPALILENDWCHSEAPWQRPDFIKAIDDISGTLRLSLKYTYIILRKDRVTLSQSLQRKNLYRITSERFDEKGRIKAFLCGENGRCEHILNKRDISQSNKDFAQIERYDIASLENIEIREHDIKLPIGAEFSIVLPNSGAR